MAADSKPPALARERVVVTTGGVDSLGCLQYYDVTAAEVIRFYEYFKNI
jgi:hypothetical protein